MTTERVSALSEEEEEDTALEYYDDEDDLEAFSDGGLGGEDGGRSVFVLCWKVTRRRVSAGVCPCRGALTASASSCELTGCCH